MFLKGILSHLGLSYLLYARTLSVVSPYRTLGVVKPEQPGSEVWMCSFALPNHVTNPDWTTVLTLWHADLTFKVASKEDTRSTS